MMPAAGDHQPEPQAQVIYASGVVGLQHKVITPRVRVFRGTTVLWAGQTLPLESIDFCHRPWLAESGL